MTKKIAGDTDKVEIEEMSLALFKKRYPEAWMDQVYLGPMLQRGAVCVDGRFRRWRTTRFSTVLIGDYL